MIESIIIALIQEARSHTSVELHNSGVYIEGLIVPLFLINIYVWQLQLLYGNNIRLSFVLRSPILQPSDAVERLSYHGCFKLHTAR